MRTDPDDEADPAERAMSQLTLVDGTSVIAFLPWKMLSEVFENEDDRDGDDVPPRLQPVSVSDALHLGDSVLAVNIPAAGASVSSNGDVAGIK